MQRCGRLGSIIGVILLSVGPATADPVRITDGALDMGSTAGSLLLQGEEFILSGGGVGHRRGLSTLAAVQSHPSCVPAQSLDLGARWSGSSIRSATVTLHGETFNNVGGGDSNASASVNFTAFCDCPGVHGRHRNAHRTLCFPG